MGPILELWNTLTSSTPGLINRRAGAAGGGGGGAAAKKMLDPVDDFVLMENDLAGDICGVVDGALASLKKVSVFFYVFDLFQYLHFCFGFFFLLMFDNNNYNNFNY